MHVVRLWLRVLDPDLERILISELAQRFDITPCKFVKELNREIGLVLSKPTIAVLSGCPFDVYIVYQVDWDTLVEDLPTVKEVKKEHIEGCKKCLYLFSYLEKIQLKENEGAH